MIESFGYYLKSGEVKKEQSNISQAKALFDKAMTRLDFIREQKITTRNSTIIFEEVYECVREAIQAVMSFKGYKPYSHIPLAAFLRDELKISTKYVSDFDNYRKIRNNSIYGAELVDAERTKSALDFLLLILPKLKSCME